MVGVGTGQDLAHLPPGTEVTGIDLSPAMLARARARDTDATLQEMNAEHLDFPDDSSSISCRPGRLADPQERSRPSGGMVAGGPQGVAR